MKHLKYKGEKTGYGVNKKGEVHRLTEKGKKWTYPDGISKAGRLVNGNYPYFLPAGGFAYSTKDLMAIAKYMKKQEP